MVWDLRIRKEVVEPGWTTCYTDGSGLDDKAAGSYHRSCYGGSHDVKSGSEYLGIKGGGHVGDTDRQQVSNLSCEKAGSGTRPTTLRDRSKELGRRKDSDTRMVWVKGHKGIKGNEKAYKLCREASILGYESEGVVTPAGLRVWSKRVRAEARGGSVEGILGSHRRAISAYAWCVTEKGPQRKWLHKIKKSDTPECHCHQEQSGEHLVEGCRLLAEARGLVEKE